MPATRIQRHCLIIEDTSITLRRADDTGMLEPLQLISTAIRDDRRARYA